MEFYYINCCFPLLAIKLSDSDTGFHKFFISCKSFLDKGKFVMLLFLWHYFSDNLLASTSSSCFDRPGVAEAGLQAGLWVWH